MTIARKPMCRVPLRSLPLLTNAASEDLRSDNQPRRTSYIAPPFRPANSGGAFVTHDPNATVEVEAPVLLIRSKAVVIVEAEMLATDESAWL
jgi:hypothetical protein